MNIPENFLHFVNLPEAIEKFKAEGKEFQVVTRSGLPVRVICVDRKDYETANFPIVGLINYVSFEYTNNFRIGGEFLTDDKTESDYDLFIRLIPPYEGWQIDEPCFFSDDSTFSWKVKGHFAGLDKCGHPMRFLNGATSFSREEDDDPVSYFFAKKANHEPD